MSYQRVKANMAIRKIRTAFPDCPEGRLMFAIIECAIGDLCNKSLAPTAKAFLSGQILQAEVCGVDSDWIHRVLATIGFDLDTQSKQKQRKALAELTKQSQELGMGYD